uniref:Uncharacterized protein n=1 Tax=Megaselia scalaris TaxID=36166 RepID=T1GZ57_MEGSC
MLSTLNFVFAMTLMSPAYPNLAGFILISRRSCWRVQRSYDQDDGSRNSCMIVSLFENVFSETSYNLETVEDSTCSFAIVSITFLMDWIYGADVPFP